MHLLSEKCLYTFQNANGDIESFAQALPAAGYEVSRDDPSGPV